MTENDDSEDEAAWETAKQMFQRMQTHRMFVGGSPTHQYLARAARPALQTESSTGTIDDRQHSRAAAGAARPALQTGSSTGTIDDRQHSRAAILESRS